MASSSTILLAILFHLLLVTKPTFSALIPDLGTQTGFQVTLTRVTSSKNRPKNRYTLKALSNADTPIKAKMKAYKDLYTMNIALGTPEVRFSAIMDTGSNLTWTKCKPEAKFDLSKSSSFSNTHETCKTLQLENCKQEYADGKVSISQLGQETFNIGKVKIPDVIFGCGVPTDDRFNGVVGLGRGKFSLVSHLQKKVFSYCLSSRFEKSKPSFLRTESQAISALASTNMDIKTTPFVKQQEDSPFYYISLEGISVGETRLPVTKSDFAIIYGFGGMIIDSGTTFTYLERRIIDMISSAFMNQTKLEPYNGRTPYNNSLKHCFKYPYNIENMPKLVFHFEGANWELPSENYIYHDKTAACLAFIANVDNEKLSIFGNMQQQNMMVLYDLDNNNLSFRLANCHEP